MTTAHRKILVEEKLTNLAIHELLAIIFSSPFFTDIPKMYLAYALISLFAKIFLANSFYLYMYGLLKFPPPKFSRVQY